MASSLWAIWSSGVMFPAAGEVTQPQGLSRRPPSLAWPCSCLRLAVALGLGLAQSRPSEHPLESYGAQMAFGWTDVAHRGMMDSSFWGACE